MKKILILLISILLISLTYAETNTKEISDTFKINEVIHYTKPCINNGTYCSVSAECNYTFYNINNAVRINNRPAINVGANGSSLWEYNLTHTEVGLYKVDMVCIDGSTKGTETLYYEVTGSGLHNTYQFNLIIIGISVVLLIIGFWLKDAPLVIFSTFGFYFIGLDILRNGIAGIQNMVTTWAIGIIILGVAAYISIKSAHELISD